MTMEVRIELRIGKIELKFEGSDETFQAKIEPILKDLIAFGKEKFATASLDGGGESSTVKPTADIPSMTVKSVASKLGGESGSALLYAAVASLAIIKKKETFTRQEINDEMKLAIGYYKPTYSNNLTSYIDTMCKQSAIIETAKDTYAVKDSVRSEMEQKLAQ